MTPMLLGHAGGMALHGCSTCGGIWLGSECAQRFSRELPKEALELAAQHGSKARDQVDTSANIACPVCGTAMQRTHAAAAELDLDFCGVHGTWYDRHEMDRIANAITETRWNQAGTDPKRAAKKEKDGEVLDTVIDGAIIAVDVLDHADAGAEVASGVFEFFSSIFD